MRYQISKGYKSFGAQDVLENITFDLKDKEKVAIVGRNGCGKTTLLKIMAGEDYLDSGDIHKERKTTIGYLSQTSFFNEDQLVEEEFEKIYDELHIVEKQLNEITKQMENDHSEEVIERFGKLQHRHEELGGYTYRSEINTVFTKFGFSLDDLKKRVNEFSGGQKTRLAFVKLLLSKPDILLLDEPTNHLDLETIKWLEGYVKRYPKAVVIVSHDRMFMDEVVSCVYEIEFNKMNKYPGNYSKFVETKKKLLEKNKVAYARQQKEIEELENLIEKFRYKVNKAKFAQSKIKYLDRMEKIEKIDDDSKKFKAHFSSRIKGGRQVLNTDDLVIGYDKPLCKVNFELLKGQRIAIIGNNGTGKSTLLKTLIRQVPMLSGSFLFGHQIEIGYFDQEIAQYNSSDTVLETLWNKYPELNRTEIRTALGCFLFKGDDVFKEINVLSGGEKVRLALADLMLKRSNLLILDEPTNHLDILGKEALEDSLLEYDGSMLFVSHDRYFINKIANGILKIENNNATYYPLTLAEVDEKSEEVIVNKKEKSKINSNINYGKEVSKLEKMINKKEEELEELREKRYEPEYYQDSKKMDELDDTIDEKHNEIAALMDKWSEYTEAMEEAKKQ